jgi:hypothetical protein
VRQDEVLWRRSGDAVVLLPAGAQQVLTLEGSGVHLWHLLAEPIALDEAAATLAEAYGTTPDRVAADIAPVLDDLSRRNAVEASE